LFTRAKGWVSLCVLYAVACGTGAPPAGGDLHLPNANVGPFRVFRSDETTKTAPQVLGSGNWSSPEAFDLDGDPATLGVGMFVEGGGQGKPRIIYRKNLPDGRAADSSESVVLKGTESWEGDQGVGDPSVLQEGTTLWLYYAAQGCIGRARSEDGGLTFEKQPKMPVFCGEQSGPAWEGGAVSDPAVYRGHDGRLRLMYAAQGGIGEALSEDGQTFRRVGTAPWLVPVSPQVPLSPQTEQDPIFDSVKVSDPFVMLGALPSGRLVTYVYYTAEDRLGRHTIGMAARWGDEGAGERAVSPVLTRYDAQAPTIVKFNDILLMYTGGASSEVGTPKPAVLGAIAPADRSIPLIVEEKTPASFDASQRAQ
jgi:hypothetical protein